MRLDGPEGRHATVVRRLAVGEPIVLTDGAGAWGAGTVRSVGRSELEVSVESLTDLPPPQPRLVVVQALPKGDRGELAVELMTEVGVDEIVPWAAARCVTQWKGERGDKALTRWRSTAREAAKQARRAWHPQISAAASTVDVARRLAGAELAVVLHEEAADPLASLVVPPRGEVVVVVGPEGGLTADELTAFATAAGRPSCRLGDTVLRTSTAGAVAAGVVLSRTRWS